MVLSYTDLLGNWLKGLRNGNWRRLRTMEKVFYRAAMQYARIMKKIMNVGIISELRNIVEKLRNTASKKILNTGIERAKQILTCFERNGVFRWLLKLKTWLGDQKYVFWLGLSSQSPHSKIA